MRFVGSSIIMQTILYSVLPLSCHCSFVVPAIVNSSCVPPFEVSSVMKLSVAIWSLLAYTREIYSEQLKVLESVTGEIENIWSTEATW